MYSDFKYTAEIVLRIGLRDRLSLDKNNPSLEVNGNTMYHLLWRPGHPLFTLKKSVFGTVISVPSLYQQRYFYDRTTFVEGPWRR